MTPDNATDRLIASLDDEAGADAGWDKIADVRERDFDAGTSLTVPLELVIARLEARFPR